MNIKRFFITLFYLKRTQIIFQIYRKLKPISKPKKLLLKHDNNFTEKDFDVYTPSYAKINEEIIYIFKKPIFDIRKKEFINHGDYLVDFSFYYFDFIHMIDISRLNDLESLFQNRYEYHNFNHPYVISKRLINLSSYYSNRKNKIFDKKIKKLILDRIEKDYKSLINNIEHHIDANHLLTNYAALSIAGKIFNREDSFKRLYEKTFISQFSSLHYERSTSYTKQLIYEAYIYKSIVGIDNKYMIEKIEQSLNTLSFLNDEKITLNFVDNIYEQALDTKIILSLFKFKDKYKHLFLDRFSKIDNFLIIRDGIFNLAIDVGTPSPYYQPGHAHDSTFAIELYIRKVPIFISGGISTYDNLELRSFERSKGNYSKIQSDYIFQDTWGGFRVGNRTECDYKTFNKKFRAFCTEGYERTIIVENNLIIKDKTKFHKNNLVQYIFSPDIKPKVKNNSSLEFYIEGRCYIIKFLDECNFFLKDHLISSGYLQQMKTISLFIEFNNYTNGILVEELK